jgi:hypothetical protein
MDPPSAAALALAASIKRRNIGTALLLTSFGVGIYFWTTNRMQTTNILGDMTNELDQVRALKADKVAAAAMGKAGK